MFNLSTQDVVLSIQKEPLVNLNGILYQEYHNFFGNNTIQELINLEDLNMLSLASEHAEKYKLRSQADMNQEIMKKLKIFFMHSSITGALADKFQTELSFASIDMWHDEPGYIILPHTDDSSIKVALQIYLGNENVGTSLFDKEDNLLKTFEYKINSGYALLNNQHSRHGMEKKSTQGTRKSLYVRYR